MVVSAVCLEKTYEKYIDKKEITTNDVKELACIFARSSLGDKRAIIQIIYRKCRRPGIELLANYLIAAGVINSKKINQGVRYLFWFGQLRETFKEIYNQNRKRRGRKI